MKNRRFSDAQIMAVLKKVEGGALKWTSRCPQNRLYEFKPDH